MVRYTAEDYTNMLFILTSCQGNAAGAVREYRRRYPNRRVPNLRTFLGVERRLRETGQVLITTPRLGRPRNIRTPQVEEAVLEAVEEDPEISTRRLGLQLGLRQSSVWRILHDQQLHPYHHTRVQELLPRDFQPRVDFAQWLLQKHRRDNTFLEKILWTDEATFTRNGVFNTRNRHTWVKKIHLPSKRLDVKEDFL